MKAIHVALISVSLVVPSVAQGAGLAHNDNFIVLAPDRPLAEELLAKADHFRKEVAEEWLGEQLPPGAGRTIISLVLSGADDEGLTWAVDSPKRKFHKLWLTTSRQGALGSTLSHEITHVVLATRFPDRLPAWAEEGAASLQDDRQRINTRRRILGRCARTGNWPELKTVFEVRTISTNDQATYSVAASVTEYFLSRGDKAKFLRFAVAGKEQGWDRALREHYGIRTVHDLQAAWQAWTSQATMESARITPPGAGRLSAKTQRRPPARRFFREATPLTIPTRSDPRSPEE